MPVRDPAGQDSSLQKMSYLRRGRIGSKRNSVYGGKWCAVGSPTTPLWTWPSNSFRLAACGCGVLRGGLQHSRRALASWVRRRGSHFFSRFIVPPFPVEPLRSRRGPMASRLLRLLPVSSVHAVALHPLSSIMPTLPAPSCLRDGCQWWLKLWPPAQAPCQSCPFTSGLPSRCAIGLGVVQQARLPFGGPGRVWACG